MILVWSIYWSWSLFLIYFNWLLACRIYVWRGPKRKKLTTCIPTHCPLMPTKEQDFSKHMPLNLTVSIDVLKELLRQIHPLKHYPAWPVSSTNDDGHPYPLPRCQRIPAIPSHPILSDPLSTPSSLRILYPSNSLAPEHVVVRCSHAPWPRHRHRSCTRVLNISCMRVMN